VSTIEVSLSDPAQLTALREWLRAMPEVGVSQLPGTPGIGEQGALDYLALLGSSGSLIAAIKILPEFLRSRRSGLSVTMKLRGEDFTIDVTNVDDVMPVLERLLDAES
jgi:hypothetical protein